MSLARLPSVLLLLLLVMLAEEEDPEAGALDTDCTARSTWCALSTEFPRPIALERLRSLAWLTLSASVPLPWTLGLKPLLNASGSFLAASWKSAMGSWG